MRNVTPEDFVFFDVETTSIDPDAAEIIEIAGHRADGRTFQAFTMTRGDVPPDIFELTGIPEEEYRRARQPLARVLRAFVAFVGEQPLAGHNVYAYDLPLLRRVLDEAQLPCPPGALDANAVDTLHWARVRYPTPPSRRLDDEREARLTGYRLSDLYQYFTGEALAHAHRAAHDCVACDVVLRALLRDAPSPSVRRAWAALRLPEARFYPDEPPAFEERAAFFERTLRVPARVPRVASHGPVFPAPDNVFPAWAEQVVQTGDVSETQLPHVLRDLAGRNASSSVAQAVLRRFPSASVDAANVLALAGSFRVKRQPDGQVRAPQADMARAVQRALEERAGSHVTLVQAPTGTGKTKGYLFPALHHAGRTKQRVIIATHTKVLQGQALEELERGAHAYQTSAVSVKSARNYVCLEALHDALVAHDVKDGADAAAALATLTAYATAGHFELEALPAHWQYSAAFRALSFSLESYGGRCRSECAFHAVCAYQTDARQRDQASIWVTNQAWLLATLGRDDAPDEVTPSKPHVVIDEAHNLEDVATEAYSVAFSGERLAFHLRRLDDRARRRGVLRDGRNVHPDDVDVARHLRDTLVPGALDALADFAPRVDAFVKQHGDGDAQFGVQHLLTPLALASADWQRLKRVELMTLDALKSVRDALRLLRGKKVRGLTQPTLQYLDDFIHVAFARHTLPWDNAIHTTHWHPQEGWSYVRRPVDLAVHLRAVWARVRSVTFTSATLTPSGDYAYFKRTLGLPDDAVELTLPETLPYERAHVVFPQHLPGARSENVERFQRLYHQELRVVLPAAQRSLTLFTSRARMQAAGSFLASLTPLMPLNRKEREDVAHVMRDAGPKIALGTRAFMEGVDFPNLKLVNLERLPFPVPDALLRARQELVAQAGLDPWYDFYLPKALLSFTQAFGRLIRDDRARAGDGAFVLWDKRVLSAAYREVVFAALPDSVARSGHFHYPTSRAAFYDVMASVLGVPRDALPSEDLLDDVTRHLRTLQAAFAEGRVSRDDAIWQVLTLFWPRVARDGLKPQQRQAIDAALDGRAALTLLPTGFGKSLTFQVPALLQGGVTVVVSPLIALMEDQVSALQSVGVPAAAVNASRSNAEQRGVLDDVERGDVHVLYVSPERINRSSEFKERLRRLARRGLVRRVVFDEAHCLSDWGHDFRPDYRSVLRELHKLDLRVSISALTATATPDVEAELRRDLALHDSVVVRASLDRPNVSYFAYAFRGKDAAVDKLGSLTQMLNWLRDDHPDGSAIVYVSTRNAATRLARALQELGFAAQAYHAGLSALVRSEVQTQFMTDEVKVIVATNAFGMGVDKANVRLVVHFNPPRSLPAYIQEAGRAGRDGAPAWAALLHDASDWNLQAWLARQGLPQLEHARHLVDLLSRDGHLTRYAEQLVADVNAALPDSVDPLDVGDLNWLLAALEASGTLSVTHRVGTVRLLSSLDVDALGADVGAAHANALWRLGYRPGRRPCSIDLAQLDEDTAEALNRALFDLAQQRPLDVLYSAHAPALSLTLRRASLATFTDVLEQQLQHKQRDLEAMKRYALDSRCRRAALLDAFRERLERRADAASCCQACNFDDRPWLLATQLSTEEIERVYKVKRTLLHFLSEFERRTRDRGLDARGLGRVRLLMTLRGESNVVRRSRGGVDTITLPSFLQLSPFFGRLEFVTEREIERTLDEATREGYVAVTPFKDGVTYQLTAAGAQFLTRPNRPRETRMPA
ncbi:RecQ family ATP-dependent DNA helicase [Deinococcus yavapaiensis]|uniref:ATP-dependent DNA helicase RecQ n=1 Tax=Deinococcus yavapaiensis KR-236 TaxID=694435 RepID=A0A318SJC7_9DEIO|nr:RecQ family ATP-dependent DNA helicase [Deinococcus yavapaiensis]PYE52043.1 ATP-dependent DNA helicase RecQ [Deinococcus yavapaiensis KR-236]